MNIKLLSSICLNRGSSPLCFQDFKLFREASIHLYISPIVAFVVFLFLREEKPCPALLLSIYIFFRFLIPLGVGELPLDFLHPALDYASSPTRNALGTESIPA